MNRYLRFLLTGFAILLSISSVFAQPSIIINDNTAPANSNVTVDVMVDNIDNIMEMQFSINWDISQFDFIEITSINTDLFSGISMADFDLTDVANGNLVFNWQEDMPNSIGSEIPASLVFQIILKTKGNEGDMLPIMVSDTPAPIKMIRDIGTGSIDLGKDTERVNGNITLSTEIPDVFFDFSLEEPKALFCKGDQFCYDIKVSDFQELGSVTVHMQWDTSVINFTGAKNFNGIENGDNFNVSFDTTTMKFGDIATIFYLDLQGFQPISLPDGTNLFTMCFEVVGEMEEKTNISFIDTKANDTEVFNSDFTMEFDAIQLNRPEITVSDCQSIISFTTECQDIQSQETACINFTATNFKDITDAKYTVTYDPTLLEFVRTENYNLNGLSAANFSDNNGVLTFDWSSPVGETVADGDFLFAACFKAIGPVDTITGLNYINLAGNGFNITNASGESLQPQFNGCEIQIAPPAVGITIPDASIPPGEEFCVPLNVNNFINITHLETPIQWDPTVLEYVGINPAGLTGLTTADFETKDVQDGKLQLVTWDSPAEEGLTLPDGAAIFEVCFKVVGDLGDQTTITLPTSEDNPPFVINSTDKQPEVNSTPGQVTVAAGGLVLSSMPQEVQEGESFCVDITTRNFTNITSLDYAHIFDSEVLTFDSVTFGADQTVFIPEDINALDGDRIKIGWATNDPLAGNTLADGTVLYTLCFTANAALGRCSNFALEETQEVTTIESAGENIGIFNRIEDICVDNFGLIVADSLHPTCDGGDGVLTLNVPGDPGERFFYFVTQDDQSFISNEDVENGQILLTDLTEGVYCVRLTSTDLSKTITKCYDLSLGEGDLPIINLGEDIDAGCIEQGTPIDLTLDGSNFTLPQNTGGVINRSWEVLGAEGTIVGDTTQDIINVTSTGTYIFTVLVSASKCAASDTISVLRTQPPRVQVQQSATLGCTNSTIQLAVEVFNPEENPNATFSWSTNDGNIVNDNTLLEPIVDEEGIYKFTVIDTVNNCIVSDSTFIFEDRIEPSIASAGPDRELGCEDDFLRLVGMGDPGAQVEWSTPDGSSIAYPNVDSQHVADVTRVGTYIFTVTNQINGCSATDTMIINADESLPVARTADRLTIGCDTSVAILDGSNSSQGSVFTYRWEDPNGALLSTENITSTETAGNYLLIVTNNENADCISDSVTVVVRKDQEEPEVRIATPLTFGCMTECSPLTATVPEGDNYTYQWTTDDGVLCGGEDSTTALVAAIGVYKIIVTNTENNCTSTTPSIVGGDGTQIFAETGPDRLIDCKNDTVTLDGRGSENGSASLMFSWENESGEEISTETTVQVSDPGEYTLKVIDTETGCDAIGKVSVTVDQALPVAEAGDSPEITGCDFPTGRRLNGNDSEQGANISYAWTTTSGNLVGDTTIAAPEISGPGRFILTVTNTTNGCTSTDDVFVQSDVIIPIVNAGKDQLLSCDEPEVALAGLSETLPAESIISWFTSDGNITGETNQLAVNVDAPGTYTLSITSPDGCTATDEVIVESILDLPDANAGQERSITCNRPLVINGTGAMGPNIDIQWSTIGGSITSGGDTYTPEVNRGGSYTLTVTNTENNCQSTSVVLIIDENNLPVANAGTDQEVCINETILMAEQPAGEFSGNWTTLENSLVLSPADANSSVADLADGSNSFLWTLSNEQCGAFSTDTLVVNVPTLPVANDDQFTIVPDQTISALDLTENDQVNSENFTVTILEQPTTGTLNEVGDGLFEFTTPARYFGTQQFQYEVCNATCSDLCAVASVRVVVQPGLGVDTTNTVPNAITPNGDGMNDMLLVDELIFDAVDFPQSEMVIFNRWGDVVFRASPYNNDWRGQSNSGDDLPEGTYYYVLRLDISEGEVMKGDVTILR